MQVKKQQLELDMEQQTGSKGCILSPCLFNLDAEYTMWNAGLDEAQAEIKTDAELKLQFFGHLMGTTEDEMDGWHHWLNVHEFEQAPGLGRGQGNLVWCSPWVCKELAMTEWLNRQVCSCHAHSVLILCNPVGCSLPGCSVHGILPARTLEWVAIPYSRASSWPRDWTCVSYVASAGTQVLYQLGHLSHKLYSLLLMSNATCYCSTMVPAHPSVKNGRKVKSKDSALTENLTMKRKYCT